MWGLDYAASFSAFYVAYAYDDHQNGFASGCTCEFFKALPTPVEDAMRKYVSVSK